MRGCYILGIDVAIGLGVGISILDRLRERAAQVALLSLDGEVLFQDGRHGCDVGGESLSS